MSFITQYKIQKDVAGYNGFGLQFSNSKYSATLTANTDTTLTVPLTGSMGAALDTVNKYLAIITVYNATGEGEVWCANNATAAKPAGSSFASTTSDMIVQNRDYAREVKAGDVLHFFTTQTSTDVSVIFYALPAN
jgi:hypothetical protein